MAKKKYLHFYCKCNLFVKKINDIEEKQEDRNIKD